MLPLTISATVESRCTTSMASPEGDPPQAARRPRPPSPHQGPLRDSGAARDDADVSCSSFRSPASSVSRKVAGLAPAPMDHSPSGREIAPFEAFVCERLTKKVTECRPSSSVSISTSSTAAASTSLAAVLDEIARAIQFHAKWFAPPALATLLDTALDAAIHSSSSLDFFNALKVVERVCTFSTLPALRPVVRFLAYAYYQGSRENRHKRLAQEAWRVSQLILSSHHGPRFAILLLDLVEDHPKLRTKVGLAAARGALLIIMEDLLSEGPQIGAPGIAPTQLLRSLRKTPMSAEVVLADQVLELLEEVLQNGPVLSRLDDDGNLGLCVEIIADAVDCSGDPDLLHSVFSALEQHSQRFDPTQQHEIARIFLGAKRPLTPALSSQLLATWRHSFLLEDDFAFSTRHRNLLDELCTCSFYLTELDAFVDICVQQYFRADEVSRRDLAFTMETVMTASTTAPPALDVLGNGLVRLFTFEMNQATWLHERRHLFPILCRLSKQSLVVAQFMLSIRADASRDLYVKSPQVEPFAPGGGEVPTARRIFGRASLQLQAWKKSIEDFISGQVSSWDIYDAMLTSLASQLRNHALWPSEELYIGHILRKICECLNADTYREPPSSSNLTKSHIVSHLIQILTATMSYSAELLPSEMKSAIVTVINVAGSRDFPVSIQCIHTLSICCYEHPELMATFMDSIINKMSKMVTQKSLALYVLEFLSGLSRLPALHDNLRLEDFKRIFGVCHSHLQSVRGASLQERKETPSSEKSTSGSGSSNEDMAQYVYALAYHVITFWYVSLKEKDRHALKPYISSCLVYTDAKLNEHVEDQGLVTIDLMDRVDAEEQIAATLDEDFDALDGRVLTRHRITGLLLITTQTALRTGRTHVTIRRPSGTARRTIQRHRSRYSDASWDAESMLTAAITVESDESDYLAIFPDDVTGRIYGKVTIPRPSSAIGSVDILSLPDDEDSVNRAIQVFDRVSALDSHKAGVVYIGEGQTTEDQILRNKSGSPDYREFLDDLGSVRRLRDAQFNSQGLDRAADADGQHTIVWNNDVTELVYHITTFMPDDPYDDFMTVINKKKHIGNDFVNIIFNNSGGEYRFDTFPSAFNYVFIVISPSDRTSFIQARTTTAAKDKKDRFYNVHVLTRPGFPSLSSAGEVKVISGTSLGAYVRNLALNACVFSAMWVASDAGEYPSSWRQRLLMIRRMYEQHRPRWA